MSTSSSSSSSASSTRYLSSYVPRILLTYVERILRDLHGLEIVIINRLHIESSGPVIHDLQSLVPNPHSPPPFPHLLQQALRRFHIERNHSLVEVLNDHTRRRPHVRNASLLQLPPRARHVRQQLSHRPEGRNLVERLQILAAVAQRLHHPLDHSLGVVQLLRVSVPQSPRARPRSCAADTSCCRC